MVPIPRLRKFQRIGCRAARARRMDVKQRRLQPTEKTELTKITCAAWKNHEKTQKCSCAHAATASINAHIATECVAKCSRFYSRSCGQTLCDSVLCSASTAASKRLVRPTNISCRHHCWGCSGIPNIFFGVVPHISSLILFSRPGKERVLRRRHHPHNTTENLKDVRSLRG